jgi:hypothetical protein
MDNGFFEGAIGRLNDGGACGAFLVFGFSCYFEDLYTVMFC